MRSKFFPALALILFISCIDKPSAIREIFSFPKKLKEISGVEVTPKSSLIWTLQDSGNKAELYALNRKGEVLHTLSLGNAENTDWEDLASDQDGNLYIGDFGNNENLRRDLCIYKIRSADLIKDEAAYAGKTEFYYPEQKSFPPEKKEHIYDAEAFFFYKGNFYIFTKNRTTPFDGMTSLYRLANKPGKNPAKLLGKFKTGKHFRSSAVTSADISPDGMKIALLSSQKVWIFSAFSGDLFLGGKVRKIDLDHFSQKEGLCFVSNSKLYITDERDKKTGGKLYELDLDSLKPEP